MVLYYFLLLLTPFWNYSRLPQFGESLTLIKVVGAIVLFLAAIKVVFTRQRTCLLSFAESRLFFLLVGIASLSAIAMSQEGWWRSPMLSYISFVAYLFATLAFVDSLERLKRSCYVVLFSMLLASVFVYSQYVKYGATRPGGVIGDANYYALSAVSMLPMTVMMFPSATRFQKAFLLVCGFSLTASTLLGQSRGGVLTLGCCLLYLLVRTRRKVLFLSGAVVAVMALILILPRTGLDRLQEDEEWGNQISTFARIELLKAGANMVAANPLVGIGLGSFKPMSSVYNPGVVRPQMGHNTYLEVAAELGIPAALVFTGIMVLSWRRARRSGKVMAERGDVAAEQVALAIETGLASFAAGATFLSAEYVKHLWILVFFGLALARISKLQKEGAALAPPAVAQKGPGHGAQRTTGPARLRSSLGRYR